MRTRLTPGAAAASPQGWQTIPLQRMVAAEPGVPVPVTATVEGLAAVMNCTSSVTAGTILASAVVRTNEPTTFSLPAQACSYVYSNHLTPVVHNVTPAEITNSMVQVRTSGPPACP